MTTLEAVVAAPQPEPVGAATTSAEGRLARALSCFDAALAGDADRSAPFAASLAHAEAAT